MKVTTKQAAEAHLDQIPLFKKKNDSEATHSFYRFVTGKCPLPEKTRVIHVAGTNGKGSVCAYLRSILTAANFETGLFTSPHLVDIAERFQIGSEVVTEEEFVDSFNQVADLVDCYQAEVDPEFYPAYFEYLFYMMFPIFIKHPVDFLIVETGLGGRLDVTNCMENPVVSIITRIGYDHMQYLGETLTEIASEKAGILKRNVPAVYLAEKDEVCRVMEQRAHELGIPLFRVNKTLAPKLSFDHKSIDFLYQSPYYGCVRSRLFTRAGYQVMNASLAICALEAAGICKEVSGEALQKGLESCFWSGRMEELMPGLFVDGAHNEDGIEAFIESVSIDECLTKRHLVFSVVSDKRSDAMIEKLCACALFDSVTIVKLATERGLSVSEIKEKFERFRPVTMEITVASSVEEVLFSGKCLAMKGDLVYMVGSLYLVGQIKEAFESGKTDMEN